MPDLRERLAEALRGSGVDRTTEVIDRQVEALLAMHDMAIVELPQPNYKRHPAFDGKNEDKWITPLGPVLRFGGLVNFGAEIAKPEEVRELAIALLAAAAVAERNT